MFYIHDIHFINKQDPYTKSVITTNKNKKSDRLRSSFMFCHSYITSIKTNWVQLWAFTLEEHFKKVETNTLNELIKKGSGAHNITNRWCRIAHKVMNGE